MNWAAVLPIAFPALVAVAIALGQFLLGRRFKKADDARAAAARKAEADRTAQTALLNQIKGAVEDHGGRLVSVETRVTGHDRELDRLFHVVVGTQRRPTTE